MPKFSYVDLKFKPDLKTHIIATYYLESDGDDIKSSASKVAAESSIGTWTDISTLSAVTFEKLHAVVFEISNHYPSCFRVSKTIENKLKKDKNKAVVKIAYPLDLFELGNIPQLLSSVCGNVFSMKCIKNLRLLDLEFPKKYINSFQGPYYGISGIRKKMNIKNRPLVGCIVKPKVGLTPKQYGKVVYNVWSNGIDVIKDDENLTSLKFNKFEDRVREVMKVKKIVEKETGEKKMYVFNVTAPFDLMLKRAKFVKKHGGKCVMIDVVSVGMDNVQLLRKQELKLIIHGHRAGHSAFTRNDEHGMTMYVLAKLARLAGIDQLHTGTVVGKMDGDEDDVIRIDEFLKEDWAGFDILEEDWSSIKPTMPIASGGLHPGLTTELMEILGNNVIINYGGGLHGHPDGSAAGARACRQSIDATLKNISLVEYAKTHEELSKALKKWENK